MRNVITFTAIGFLGSGLIMGACAVSSLLNTREFLHDSVTATAKVISLEEHLSSRDSVLYSPVFRFRTASGRVRTFMSQHASNPPAYDVGDTAEVAYRRSNYSDVRETSFYSLWGMAVGLGAFGSILAGIGGGILVHRHVKAKRDAALRQTGIALRANFQRVELNHALTVNGVHPWRIVAHWSDASSGSIRVFHSDNIWFDPTFHITTEQIIVYVDPEKPRRYCMDLSFLPTLA